MVFMSYSLCLAWHFLDGFIKKEPSLSVIQPCRYALRYIPIVLLPPSITDFGYKTFVSLG